MLGQGVLSFIERCPLFGGYNVQDLGRVVLSVMERCALFGVTFIGGCTYNFHMLHVSTCVQSYTVYVLSMEEYSVQVLLFYV